MDKVEESISFNPDFIFNINFIHEVKIYNEIQNNKKIIIFDLRKRDDCKKTNLEFTINIPFDEHDDNFFLSFDESKFCEKTNNPSLKEMILKYKRYYIVIVMSEEKIERKRILNYSNSEGEEKNIIRKSLLLYEALTKKRVREIGLFNLGFTKFVEHYYFIIKKNEASPLAK